MTLVELNLFLDSKSKLYKETMIENAQFNFVNNNHLTELMGLLFRKARIRSFEEVYSFLLDKSDVEKIEQAKQDIRLEKEQARWIAWADAFNKKQGGEINE